MKIPAALANVIIGVVTLVWAGNFAAGIFLPGYESDASLNFVFMTIVGGALALRGGPDDGTGGLLARLAGALRPPAAPSQPKPVEPPAAAPTGREDRS